MFSKALKGAKKYATGLKQTVQSLATTSSAKEPFRELPPRTIRCFRTANAFCWERIDAKDFSFDEQVVLVDNLTGEVFYRPLKEDELDEKYKLLKNDDPTIVGDNYIYAFGAVGIFKAPPVELPQQANTPSFPEVKPGQETLYLILITECYPVCKLKGKDVFQITKTLFWPLRPVDPERRDAEIGPVKKLLESGFFYFSRDYDLTHTQQRIVELDKTKPLWQRVEPRYFWNRLLLQNFMKLGVDQLILPIMQGFVRQAECVVDNVPFTFTVISRRNTNHAGTRYNTRGVDNNGNVANNCETEQIVTLQDGAVMSFVETRGSVPLFWEQKTDYAGQYKPKPRLTMARDVQAVAFKRHFDEQLRIYGDQVCISLVEQNGAESVLANEYREQWQIMNHSSIDLVAFDFHHYCKGNKYENLKILLDQVEDKFFKLGYFVCNKDGVVLRKQKGVFRTNCVDCLDRTNVVQTLLARRSLEWQLVDKDLGLSVALKQAEANNDQGYQDFEFYFKNIWSDNGDAISTQYAGTGALKSEFTRTGKRNMMGMIDDGVKSVSRYYINNISDIVKQKAIDTLLGVESRAVDERLTTVKEIMKIRESEYSEYQDVSVVCSTYNVNGTKPRDLLPEWTGITSGSYPDIVAVSLQEMVDLDRAFVTAIDPNQIKAWEDWILRNLSSGPVQYKEVMKGSLVGLFVAVYAKADLVDHIKEKRLGEKKTGMAGYAGNKGAIAIRFLLKDSSFCFVGAHMAAGEEMFEKRNQEFQDVWNGINFGLSGGRGAKATEGYGDLINDHEHVFWFGDLNYRVRMSLVDANDNLRCDNWRELLEVDELRYVLRKSKKTDSEEANTSQNGPFANVGKVDAFADFEEGPINFPPTYKYEPEATRYDTEKGRTPSWCDRVLWKTDDPKKIRNLWYRRYELLASDHRPVGALFEATVRIVNRAKQSEVREQVLKELMEGQAEEEKESAKDQDVADLAADSPTGAASDFADFVTAPAVAASSPSRNTPTKSLPTPPPMSLPPTQAAFAAPAAPVAFASPFSSPPPSYPAMTGSQPAMAPMPTYYGAVPGPAGPPFAPRAVSQPPAGSFHSPYVTQSPGPAAPSTYIPPNSFFSSFLAGPTPAAPAAPVPAPTVAEAPPSPRSADANPFADLNPLSSMFGKVNKPLPPTPPSSHKT